MINSLRDATDRAQLHACDLTIAPFTSLLVFHWAPTYVSLTNAPVERLLTQQDCMVCCAEGATVDAQRIAA